MLRTGPIATNRYELPDGQFGSNEQDPVNVQSILEFFRRSRRACLIWALIGLCIGIAFILFSRSYYTAYTTLLLEDRTIRPFPEAPASFEPADTAYADSQVQVLLSKEVVGRVVDQYNLVEDDEFGHFPRGMRARLVETLPFLSAVIRNPAAEQTPQSLQFLTIIRVSSALSVRRIGISNAVEISFTSRDPHRAAEIANAIAKAYIDSRLELKQRAREDAAAQLRERLAEAREKAFNSDPPTQEKILRSPESGEQARERFRELQNTTETYRVLYNSFLQRYTEAVQQFSLPGARVITPAEPPLDRSWPLAFLVLPLTMVGGAAGGLAYSLLRQVTDQTLRNCRDLQRATGLDCLAEVGLVKQHGWLTIHHEPDDLQSSYVKASAPFGDAIAKAAVYLQATRLNSNGSVIGVTALEEGVGSSSVAAHLARVFAQSGQKTLLLDANWRMPDPYLHTDHSSHGGALYQRSVSVDLGSGVMDILIIRGGSDITDLLASQSIMAALLRMQADYACMVIDFHALERTADVVACLSTLDDLILVAEAGRTSAESLRNALRSLPREKVSLVLNKVHDR